MEWKRYVTYLSFFGVGIVVGYLLAKYIILGNIGNLLISGVVIVLAYLAGGSDILGRIIDYFISRREKKAKQEEKKLGEKIEHSERLVKSNISLRLYTKIKYLTENGLHIQEDILDSLEFIKWSPWVEAHLKTGYPRIWKLMEQRNKSIEEYNIKLQRFLKDLHLRIRKEIEQTIPEINEWDLSYQLLEPKKYFTKDLWIQIENHVQFYDYKYYNIEYRSPLSLTVSSLTAGKYGLYLSHYLLVVSDNEKELHKIKESIEKIFDDEIKSPEFKGLNDCFEKIRTLHERDIKKELLKITCYVDEKVPLNGECDSPKCGGIYGKS